MWRGFQAGKQTELKDHHNLSTWVLHRSARWAKVSILSLHCTHWSRTCIKTYEPLHLYYLLLGTTAASKLITVSSYRAQHSAHVHQQDVVAKQVPKSSKLTSSFWVYFCRFRLLHFFHLLGTCHFQVHLIALQESKLLVCVKDPILFGCLNSTLPT